MLSIVVISCFMLGVTQGLDSMEDSVRDLLEETSSENEARFFNYDRGAAFNTSVAFTIPLFSFTLPGAADATEQGLDGNTFGVLAFVAIFLIGGLGVAIYTTTQGGNEDSEARAFGKNEKYFDSKILNNVLTSIEGLPEALSVDSCTKLSVCEAHSEPQKYGLLAWPFKMFIPPMLDVNENEISGYQKAANFGYKKEDECYYEYPCLVQPLDVVMYLKDVLISH